MVSRNLDSLLPKLKILHRRGAGNPELRGIAYDSRHLSPGELFVALEGLHRDGHDYVDRAIRSGAVAIVHSHPLPRYKPGIPYLQVQNPRRSLSTLADAFYHHPSVNLTVIGVTGTDGKSTTVWLIHQLLEALGQASGFLSTVNYQTGERVRKNPLRQSTPEAPEVQAMLHQMVRQGKDYAVLEATSHGLSERTARLADVQFDMGVLTNISHEHLEFHGSLEQYRSDKANLFRALGNKHRQPPQQSLAVLNREDPHFDFFRKLTPVPVFTYGLQPGQADLQASELEGDLRSTRFTLHFKGREVKSHLNLPGPYNVENLMAAALTVMQALQVDLNYLIPLLPGLKGVKGRLEILDEGQPFLVIVDYAHTPDSFERLFSLVRPRTPGALLAVFGSAGERDREKRPLQGRIAARYCDLMVLTDEDPRGEDPEEILRQIAAGCPERRPGKELFLEPDRHKAIALALERARPGDTVLLLGKGHEASILYAEGARDWDEAEIARGILRGMGFVKDRD